ncbi:6-pyruvoyl trahydropterin synthase family protein, partial [Staphylococcus haemolyticus]|uniref:6-pyruvoyl trahydropterin synthase family protein n=1 Tax=Staphylococcus haemolyticus TaxID=1283 RepID=UPI003B827581
DLISPICDYGLLLYFNDLDSIYNKVIEPILNHQLINETLPDMNTTAENIEMCIWDEFEQHIPGENFMYELQLFETER